MMHDAWRLIYTGSFIAIELALQDGMQRLTKTTRETPFGIIVR